MIKLFVQGNLWTWFPWPTLFLKAWIRRRFRPETFGPTEEYRKTVFHKLSIAYALMAWTAVGVGGYLYVQPKVKKEGDNSDEGALPYQDDIDKGGAIYWMNALKSPEEMQNIQGIKVVRFSGLSYQGTEDVTVKSKEIGQARARREQAKGHDLYLRKRYSIPTEDEGGPSNAELRDQFEREGKDYELELDFSNQIYRVKTRYNPDGTVGEFVN